MPITIDWVNRIIHVPQSYLTPIVGTLYELDTGEFRRNLKSLEDDEAGMAYPDTHRHNTTVTVAGTTYARTIEIINGYKVEFEDGQYSVRLTGSNNNVFDVEGGVLVQNQVQLIAGNAAGLVTSGSGDASSVEYLRTRRREYQYATEPAASYELIYNAAGTVPEFRNRIYRDLLGNSVRNNGDPIVRRDAEEAVP